MDSRTILDQNGAEALLGNGDMLFLPPGKSEPLRLQGAFIGTEETERVMEWYVKRREARRAAAKESEAAESDILETVRALEAAADGGGGGDGGDGSERDSLFREAAEACIQNQGGSTSLLQRRLEIGYGRAARIIDQLQMAGILSPPDGSQAPRRADRDSTSWTSTAPEAGHRTHAFVESGIRSRVTGTSWHTAGRSSPGAPRFLRLIALRRLETTGWRG